MQHCRLPSVWCLSLVVLVQLTIAALTPLVAAPPSAAWPLVWSDEFNGTNIDQTKWSIGALPWGGRHHNDQYASYIMPEDSYVQNGSLILRSRKGTTVTPFGGYPYSEGFAHTSGKLDYTYGYLEIRATFPVGKGVWPAFWTLPQGWPPEFDIAEYFGTDDRMHMGLAHGVCCPANWDSQSFYHLNFAASHTYGLEWGPGYAIYYMDSLPMRAIYAGYVPAQPIYVILNSGTRWDADGSTPFPNNFSVDYVRLFKVPAITVNDNTAGTGLSQFNYVGSSWSYNGSQGGAFFNDNHWAGQGGAAYQVEFRGTRIDLYGARDPVHGIAAVSVDGGAESSVDFYGASRQDKAFLWTSGTLGAGVHTLKVRVTGTKNSASAGTAVTADRVDIWTAGAEALTGNILGTLGSWNNSGTTRERVFDGDLNNYFDAATPNGVWVGLGLNPAQGPKDVTRIRYCPRTGFGARMIGGRFQGSNRPDFSNPIEYYTVTTAPLEDTFTEVVLTNHPTATFVRYLAPTGSYGNVAEIEFYGESREPLPLNIEDGLGGVGLSWDAAPGATNYTINRATNLLGSYHPIGTTTLTNYTDTAVVNELPYYYQIVGNGSTGGVNSSGFKGPGTAHGAPLLALTLNQANQQFSLSWPGWATAFAPRLATNLTPPINWLPTSAVTTRWSSNGNLWWSPMLTNTPPVFFQLGR